MKQAQEQQDETSTNEVVEGQDPGQEIEASDTDSEAQEEEFEVVLAEQEESVNRPKKSNKDYILNRVMKRDQKLQNENAALKAKLDQQAVSQQPASVQSAPDEYAYDDRNEYLKAHAVWQRQMLSDVVSGQLNQQQNGHRIAAREQEEEEALTVYANNAAQLKVSNFNDIQDKAFDVLGEEFARMIARELPEDGPKLMYHLGRNPKEAVRLREQFQSSPGRTTFTLGKLAANLNVRKKQSSAAAPEAKIESGSVGGINADWQAQLDKLDDSVDMGNISKTLNARREIKKKAKEAGFDVSTLK